jgi:hypothetical protein
MIDYAQWGWLFEAKRGYINIRCSLPAVVEVVFFFALSGGEIQRLLPARKCMLA